MDTGISACPVPFLDQADFPVAGGYTGGRFCATSELLNNATCCLPCPVQDWIFSNDFPRTVDVALWFNVPALVAQVLLMLTFIVLGPKEGHGHYLSWGLVICLVFFELSFIVPLGTKPEMCYDAITPNSMTTSLSCAFTGALLEVGSMGAVSWILVRSLYTHLRVAWNIEWPTIFPYISHGVGWGLPALFLAISLPITGLSYQAGPTCQPSMHATFVTWFGWMIALASLAAVIQLVTSFFCVVAYAASFRRGGGRQDATLESVTSSEAPLRSPGRGHLTLGNRVAWRRVKTMMALQWRSVLLSFLVIVETVYFGATYAGLTQSTHAELSGSNSGEIQQWVVCLVLNKGDKGACTEFTSGFQLQERIIVANFLMAALIGIFTFLLMIRRSMFVGWYKILRDPGQHIKQLRNRRRDDEEDFVIVSPRRQAAAKTQEFKESVGHSKRGPGVHPGLSNTGILPEPENQEKGVAKKPEAGDVSKRHETTYVPDEDDDEKEGEEKSADE